MFFPSETPSPTAVSKESTATETSTTPSSADLATAPSMPSVYKSADSNSEMKSALEPSQEMNDMDMGNDEPNSSLPPLAPQTPSVAPQKAKTARCKKGTRKNKTTGACEPSKKKSRQSSTVRAASDIVLRKSKTLKDRLTALENVHHQIVGRLIELENR